MSDPRSIIAADVTYDGPTAVELRHELIALRNRALGPEVFDPQTAVILSHTVALLGALIERTWPEMAGELAKVRL